jgi:hypothetical protein
MPDIDPFGNRYYGQEETKAARRPGKRPDTFEEARLRKLLAKDVRDRVQGTVKQWNQFLRELIRTETALRLSTNEAKQAVPVKVEDGLPLPFNRILRDVDELLLWLTINRPSLEAAAAGLDKVIRKFPDLMHWPPIKQSLDKQEDFDDFDQPTFRKSQLFIQTLLHVLESRSIFEQLKNIDEDVLGAYFFRIPEIRLYWMAIGFFAHYLDVPVEALTVVTLAHELAHSYSHLGKDIDGRDWDIKAFAEADLYIVEGLAQFYTEVACKRLTTRYPGAYYAYQEFLKIQGGPYLAHCSWGGDDGRAGEVIRISMLHTRTNQVTLYNDFLKERDRAQNSLGR